MIEWDEEAARLKRARYQRTRRLNTPKPHVMVALRNLLFDQQGGRCYYCGREMLRFYPSTTPGPRPDHMATLEHLEPVIDGSATDESNCVAACNRCNALAAALSQSCRSLERAMTEGFVHERHYYAERLARAIAQWDERTSFHTKENDHDLHQERGDRTPG